MFKKITLLGVMALLCLNFGVLAQQRTPISGTIINTDGQPIPNANISTKDKTATTQSDDKGNFKLNGIAIGTSIIITSIGYASKEITMQKANIGTIVLETAEQNLQEVEVNAGYYRVRDRERTGSISRIISETIEKQPINNPLQALQGRVPGMEITQLTGVPGGGFRVQIRGRNSISSGNDPLYVVDGVTFPSSRINNANSNNITQDASPLSMINPNDISSIEVLKDADATAIYGSRGANGVILITTKNKTSENLRVNVNYSQGLSQVGNRLNLMNTEQYIAMRLEAFKNDGLNPSSTDYDVNGVWDKNKYTDWQSELIGRNAGISNASVSVSGGSKSANYMVSGNNYSEGTVFAGNFGYNKLGINSSLNLGANESRLKASFVFGYTQTKSNFLLTDPTTYITQAPNAPDAYDEYGKLNWRYNNTDIILNPMAPLNNTIDAITNNIIGNAVVNYKVLDNLTFKTSVGYNKIDREELAKRPNIAKYPTSNPTSANRESRFGNNFNKSWIVEPQLNYAVNLGNSKINSLVGMSFQENEMEYRNILASGFNGDEVMNNISSASVFSIAESNYSAYKYAALFARLNYSLFDRYFINLTARRDGSSRFGPGKQFANFWAIGTAWVFSDEKFIKNNISFLSFGKIRASYGVTGNDQIANYGYMQLYNNTASYQGTPTLNIGRIANPDFAWETNKKAEISLELGLFGDLANFQFAYFQNRSSNQLVGLSLPPSVGSTTIQANLPAIVQNTGLELEARLNIIKRKSWDWTTSINLTIPMNKLVSYPGLENSANATNYIIGMPLAINRYYDTTVDKQTGLYTVKDFNGNGVMDDADRYLNKFIGQIFYGGLQNSVRYKHFSLDLFVSFTKQNGNSLLYGISYPPGYFAPGVSNVNQPIEILNSRWTKVGDDANIPKFTTLNTGVSNFNLGKTTGTQSVADASFIRLKNVSLSYSIPKNWFNSLKIADLQINIQGQNLFTLTKYAGLDPENQYLNRLPPLRTFLAGIKLTF